MLAQITPKREHHINEAYKLNIDALVTCFIVFHHEAGTMPEIDSRSLVFIRGSTPSNQTKRFTQSPSACR